MDSQKNTTNKETNTTIHYLSGEPGSGKTTALIAIMKTLVASTDRVLLVQPTHALLTSTIEALTEGSDGIDTARIAHVQHDTDSTLQLCINAITDVSKSIICCTDRTAFRLSPVHFTGLTVIIDDVTSTSCTRTVQVTSTHKTVLNEILSLTDHSGYYSYTIAPAITDGTASTHDINGCLATYKPAIEYDKMYMSGDVFDPSTTQIQLLFAFDLTKMRTAKRIIAARSNFENTMLYQTNKHLINFVPLELPQPYDLKHNTEYFNRLNVMYYMQNGRFSGEWQRNNPDAYKAMIDHAAGIIGDVPTLYTRNSTADDIYSDTRWHYVAPFADGLNDYRDYTCVVYMCSMLPSAGEIQIYKAVFGEHMSFETVAAARNYETLYQFLNRSNIRDYKSKNIVTIIVPDRFMAEYLSNRCTHIPGVVDDSARTAGRPAIDAPAELQHNLSIWRTRNKNAQDYLTKAKKIATKYAIKYPDHIEYINNRLLGTQK